jgi:hypothetical protein
MEDENVLDYCTTDYWAWVCTDRRVMKYREGSGTAEQLHDISFDEISSISLVNTGRNDKLGGYGIFTIVVGGLLAMFNYSPSSWSSFVVLMLSALVGGFLLWKWANSEKSYFVFKGSGVISENSEEWRIDQTDADNSDEIREFTKTVRGQL